MLLVDILAREGEPLDAYHVRATADVDDNWVCFDPESRVTLKHHISTVRWARNLRGCGSYKAAGGHMPSSLRGWRANSQHALWCSSRPRCCWQGTTAWVARFACAWAAAQHGMTMVLAGFGDRTD